MLRALSIATVPSDLMNLAPSWSWLVGRLRLEAKRSAAMVPAMIWVLPRIRVWVMSVSRQAG